AGGGSFIVSVSDAPSPRTNLVAPSLAFSRNVRSYHCPSSMNSRATARYDPAGKPAMENVPSLVGRVALMNRELGIHKSGCSENTTTVPPDEALPVLSTT